MTILHAIQRGDLNAVKDILKNKKPKDCTKALINAAKENKFEIVKYLISINTESYMEGGAFNTPLDAAIWARKNDNKTDNDAVIKLLIKHPSKYEVLFFDLRKCAEYNFVDVAQWLLEANVPLEYKNIYSDKEENLLEVAAKYNSIDFIKFLLDQKFDYKKNNRIGDAYEIAKIKNNSQVIELLKPYIMD